ncbi:MAG: histone deacetylase [Aquificota bacterium]|jgi:acetoin utilization deacetylase AcuC-like enzyme
MKVGFVIDERYLLHHYEGHPENKYRLEAIDDGMRVHGLYNHVELIEPFFANADLITLNHDPQYIEEVMQTSKSGGGWLDPDTYVNTHTFDVARLAVGGVIKATQKLLDGEIEGAFCAIRPPGHHAEYAKAMGFCIFNNVAIAARYLLNKGLERIFIVDFDAHHGNGTQHAFYTESRVFYFSTHQYPFYPGTGSAEERGAGEGYGTTLNIPMPFGADDELYKQAYGETLVAAVRGFKPQFMLVSAGYDLHKEDPLTGLNVTDKGVEFIVETIVRLAKELNIPVLFALEGGYNLDVLKRNVPKTVEIMLSP